MLAVAEMKAVAALLGVPGVSLYRGFSTRTRDSHGQLCHTITDSQAVSASLFLPTVLCLLSTLLIEMTATFFW